MFTKQSKFRSTEERFAHLHELWSKGHDSSEAKQATKLAWMWLKTGIITSTDFQKLLSVFAASALSK